MLDLRMSRSTKDGLNLVMEVETAEAVLLESYLIVGVEDIRPFLLGASLDRA